MNTECKGCVAVLATYAAEAKRCAHCGHFFRSLSGKEKGCNPRHDRIARTLVVGLEPCD